MEDKRQKPPIISILDRRQGEDEQSEIRRIVIALGGNAILKASQVGTIEEQFANTEEACSQIVRVIKEGHSVILTHGNGPQVGNILRRVEIAAPEIYTLPLDVCVADSQGGMGFMLQEALNNEAIKADVDLQVATIITRCQVEEDDPAFKNPVKPIGSFMTEEEAQLKKEKDGWDVVEDSGRGWRRVVPSPWPKKILERNLIKTLVENNYSVIACGGGGVPVCKGKDGLFFGVEAVIDKDVASALLALEVKADIYVILTGVEKVQINFGKPDAKSLDNVSIEEVKQYMEEGQFPPGSMGPKMQAALFFLESGGKEVLITDTINLLAAMRGETGTRIRSNEVSADAADNKDGKLEKNAEVIEKTVKSAAEEEISPDVTPDDTPSPEARV